ncbi:MAG: PASTA domain-containing protein [Actinomycetota bacterium]
MRHRRPYISLLLATATVASVGIAGCASDAGKDSGPQVILTVSSPRDKAVVATDSVEISGRVRPPEASVTVLGRRARVGAGGFSARVPLKVGTNVVDVIATAPDRSPAMTAIRVTRQDLVEIPHLSGDSPEDARRRLVAVGLVATIKDSSGIFDDLLPVATKACESDPPAGSKVEKGTSVVVLIAKIC